MYWLYALVNDITGEFLKWGMTKNGFKRYKFWWYNQNDARMVAILESTDKGIIKTWERTAIRSDPGPYNRESWRGIDAESATSRLEAEGGRILGVADTLIQGADVAYHGIAEVIKYRWKIQSYIDDIDDDDPTAGGSGGVASDGDCEGLAPLPGIHHSGSSSVWHEGVGGGAGFILE